MCLAWPVLCDAWRTAHSPKSTTSLVGLPHLYDPQLRLGP